MKHPSTSQVDHIQTDKADGCQPVLYGELASWWPLLSPVADYAEDAAILHRVLSESSTRPIRSLLELGSGGGNTASHLKAQFDMTLVDLSAPMLEVSGVLNPECEHVRGDMRTIRLDRTFDAVLIHDAIAYMTTEADVRAAIETAFIHCAPGGAALFVPDCVRENFRESTDSGGSNDRQRGLRFLEWRWDPDPNDTTYIVEYAFLVRESDGTVRLAQDRHQCGLFARDLWLSLIADVGFEARRTVVPHSQLEPASWEMFVGVRPQG